MNFSSATNGATGVAYKSTIYLATKSHQVPSVLLIFHYFGENSKLFDTLILVIFGGKYCGIAQVLLPLVIMRVDSVTQDNITILAKISVHL